MTRRKFLKGTILIALASTAPVRFAESFVVPETGYYNFDYMLVKTINLYREQMFRVFFENNRFHEELNNAR